MAGLIGGDQTLQNQDSQRTLHKGIVKSVDDPTRKGRIKCVVAGMYEDESNLPWCYPHGSITSFKVPRVGDELTIEFPYKDKYMPVYTGKWESSRTHDIKSDENYPYTSLFPLGDGAWFKWDDKLKTAEFRHPTGAFIFIDSSGGAYIESMNYMGLHTNGIMYIGGDKGVFLESAEGCVGIGAGINMSLQSTIDIALKTGLNISMDSAGINSTNASAILHNCGFFNAISGYVSSYVKSIGVSVRTAMITIKKKLDIIQAASKAKEDKVKSV